MANRLREHLGVWLKDRLRYERRLRSRSKLILASQTAMSGWKRRRMAVVMLVVGNIRQDSTHLEYILISPFVCCVVALMMLLLTRVILLGRSTKHPV